LSGGGGRELLHAIDRPLSPSHAAFALFTTEQPQPPTHQPPASQPPNHNRIAPPQVVVYHGARRATTTRAELEAADVVLTTYSTIEADYRRTMMPKKVACT